MARGSRQGIPTLEVTIGDYPDDWQIAEVRRRIEERVRDARLDGLKVTQGARKTDLVVEAGGRWNDL